MKRLGIASFTANGSRVADALAAAFETDYEIVRYEKGLKDWCGGLFAAHADGIIFVGACGIAVRTIAPFLVSKTTDPAVLVIDEKGQFVISLLSGHIGGANRLALRAADVLGATPVITTATDVNGKFAVDVFASDNHLRMEDMRLAKEISAAILRGENIGVYCEGEIEGEIPPELTLIGSRTWSGRILDSSEESGETGEPGESGKSEKPEKSGVAARLDDAVESSARAASEKTNVAPEAQSAVGNTAKTAFENYSEVGSTAKTALEYRSADGSTAKERPVDAMICIGVPSRSFVFSEERREHPASSFFIDREIDIWAPNFRIPILCLFPKVYVLGIGCRKGKSEAAIARAVEQATADLGLSPEDIVGVASIDLKKEEPGLVKFCQKRNLRFCTFPAEMLAEVRGVFTGSSFVESVTGVDNVCERAALCLAKLLSEPPGPLADTSLDGEAEDDDSHGDQPKYDDDLHGDRHKYDDDSHGDQPKYDDDSHGDRHKYDEDPTDGQQKNDDDMTDDRQKNDAYTNGDRQKNGVREKYAFLKKASGESGRLILGKQAIDGVTVAVAERKWSVRF